MSGTIHEAIDGLKQTLISYIEATYHIGDPRLVAQRRILLEQVGGIFQVPFIESTPRYRTGRRFDQMLDIPVAAREAFSRLARAGEGGPPLLFDPPYTHQDRAIEEILARQQNVMIMTGTGSGKTESFLLPILGKLAIEACTRPNIFRAQPAMRALILYPMNALVNDQLGRLRLLFGDRRVIAMFQEWAGRPIRFTRYTSRTPYPGLRTAQKDQSRLGQIGEFYAATERAAARDDDDDDTVNSRALFDELRRRGKWPAKDSVAEWYGASGTRWQDANSRFRRAVLRPLDAELLTRHEAHENPPDVLITNYSMLEYMMMRPIERAIFDSTRDWLSNNPNEKFLVVLDEAHLYRGAAGAEVGLLMRRLRTRLGLSEDRFQVICSTASFSNVDEAGEFGAQLTGCPVASFVPVQGDLLTQDPAAAATDADVRALCDIDLSGFYAEDSESQIEAIQSFLRYRDVQNEGEADAALYAALVGFSPLNLLINETMRQARRLDDLAPLIFPTATRPDGERALTALLAIGSRAKLNQTAASLIPCRVHSFFRGLPGLWVCMDPDCSELPNEHRSGFAGTLFSQPRERCGCGARVLEYFTCRNCGSSYARAYTNDLIDPHMVWSNPGELLHTPQGILEAVHPIDLLLEEAPADSADPAFFDLETGQIDPARPSARSRIVRLTPRNARGARRQVGANFGHMPGEFVPCGICGLEAGNNRSSVQDHQTEGDQPFQALVTTQIAIQPPGPQPATAFAPLRGRKVLLFSDSRQMAARLAPRLQSYSGRDAARTLVAWGFSYLRQFPRIAPRLDLQGAFAAAMIASNRLEVSLRPELRDDEALPTEEIRLAADNGAFEADEGPFDLWLDISGRNWPNAVILNLTAAIADRFIGLEALAIASIRERDNLTARVDALPDIPGIADDLLSKRALARAWIRCWVSGRRPAGIWYNGMPHEFWTNEVRAHSGQFDAMNRILRDPQHRRLFSRTWLPILVANGFLVERSPEGSNRMVARALTLEFEGQWRRCPHCKSVHRPIPRLTTCIDCGRPGAVTFDPDNDAVFHARKGYYRDPILACLQDSTQTPVAIVAAEHTAQLNTSQSQSVFSPAEQHEMLFQDVNLSRLRGARGRTAIDVLSSTTTMEVGIDIGALSGVALRNMPPGRSNYQQRAGRAGRRGNAVASVMAFGSADSHDEHYFSNPAEMITGPVVDPRLTLENRDIARRHVRAFLLQRYHEDRIQGAVPATQQSLFSVLGNVGDFRNNTGILNRTDLADFLSTNAAALQQSLRSWLPAQLSETSRDELVFGMIADLLRAIDEAVGFVQEPEGGQEDEEGGEAESAGGGAAEDDQVVAGGEDDQADPLTQNLLERLLYHGVLPRYAFPTDVANFYVFDRERSNRFRTETRFEPSQGLPIALSQYAPGKQVWIAGRCYISKAIFSPHGTTRRQAWRNRELYFECQNCGYAHKEFYDHANLNSVRDCDACGSQASLGPGRRWFRPPGFAHPADIQPETEPDRVPEASRATRAKLIMTTPDPGQGWLPAGPQLRAFPTRARLLVSNTGLNGRGYTYCRLCGRIESAESPTVDLFNAHSKPYPGDDRPCTGSPATHTMLGTDFPTDVTLFSIQIRDPFRLAPGLDHTAIALRTVCEALARAACRLLELEPGEVLAEFRPAMTPVGRQGGEAEIFIYDTLPGGAGFSSQLANRGYELVATALHLLTNCPGHCDSSCYRCLRSFRNKFEHAQIDRFVGAQLLQHVLDGGTPEYSPARVATSADLLVSDLRQQTGDIFSFERNVNRLGTDGQAYRIPIVLRRRSNDAESWVALASPITEGTPSGQRLTEQGIRQSLICIDEFVVRKNLPAAVQSVLDQAR